MDQLIRNQYTVENYGVTELNELLKDEDQQFLDIANVTIRICKRCNELLL